MVVSKTSGSVDKSRHKLRKNVQKQAEEKKKAREDATVEISLSNGLSAPAKSGRITASSPFKTDGPKKSVPSDNTPAVSQETHGHDSESEADSEIEQQEQLLDRKGKGRANGIKAFQQRDLVALAFAGDNVVQVCFSSLRTRCCEVDLPRIGLR